MTTPPVAAIGSAVEVGRLTPRFVPSQLHAALVEDSDSVGWVGVDEPDPDRMGAVLHGLGIGEVDHQLLVETPRRGRFHLLEDRGLLVTVPTSVGDPDEIASLQLVVGRHALIAISRHGAAGGVVALRERTEARLLAKDPPLTPALVLEAVLLPVFADAEAVLDGLEDDAELLAQRLFPDVSDDDVTDLADLAGRLLVVERAILPLARGIRTTSLQMHLHGEADAPRPEARVALAALDIEERLRWLADRIDWITDTTFTLSWRESNILTGRQNTIAQRISAYAALLAVPAGVFSLYGINFEHLPYVLRSTYGYPILLAGTGLLMATLAWQLHRRGWL